MISLRTLTISAAAATFGLLASAQTPVNQAAHHPAAAASAAGAAMPMGGASANMERMDAQMKDMSGMHEKMMQAKTPQERSALMAEHMKVMKDGMAMMNSMGKDGMMGKGGMAGMAGMKDKAGKGAMSGEMAMHHQMMEKRMEMMQSMMQMMMDGMPQAGATTEPFNTTK